MLSKPKAVVISDIHFTPQTLEIASEAFLLAQKKALELGVPLVVSGDTLDTKDIMRAQCVNKIIQLIECSPRLEHYFLVGNHDMLNEKGSGNSLNFLNLLTNSTLISVPTHALDMYFIPYQNSIEAFASLVKGKKGIIIAHQGIQGANMGHYVQDKTSINPIQLPGKRIISGHYHQRQDLKLPKKGLWSYVGNPYTLSFGEAKDPEKGFQILMEDGSLEFVPTNLRQHKIYEISIDQLESDLPSVNSNDVLWLKLTGSSIDLEKLNKKALGEKLFGHSNFRFDKIPTETPIFEIPTVTVSKMDLLNHVIDNTDESLENKEALKLLAKELINET